jgi:hypothetical protein
MLQEILLKKEEEKIILKFDLKNQGKFRLKKFQDSSTTSTYGNSIKKENLSSTKWYLEWQISYFVYTSEIEKKPPFLVLKDKKFKTLNGKKAYPFELSFFLYQAVKINLLKKEKLNDLIKWISKVPETEILESKLQPNIRSVSSPPLSIEGLKLIPAYVDLPFLIYEHNCGVWVEIVWEKQQFAYSCQPMVYLCIPHYKFIHQNEWHLTRENVDILLDLFKIFGITSKRHKKDVLEILNILNELLPQE